MNMAILFAIMYSYFSLTKLLKKYHPERYEKVKYQMRFFASVEMVGLICFVGYNIAGMIMNIYN